MAATNEADEQRLRCARCSEVVGYRMLLPCQHVSCQKCIEIIAREANRPHGLSCPSAGCNSKFAIVLPPEPNCGPRPTVQMPFVRDRYAADIRLRTVVRKCRDGRKIMGIAQLEKSLYVVSREGFLDEYNVEDVERITGPQCHPMTDLRWPRGLAASRRFGVVYITDWQRLFGGALLRFATRHATQPGLTKVVLEVQPFGVSVSEAEGVEVSIFVTCVTPMTGSDQQIEEYRDTGTDLWKVRIIELPGHFQIPRHAVLMESGVFAVCHGWTMGRHHRVSKMSCTGDVLTEISSYGTYGGDEIQHLRCPLSLCVDEDGLILVVDYYNHRIQLLSHHLQLVRHLITKRDNIEYPRHVCLDSSRGLLYVGLQSGDVHVFQVR